MKVSRVWVSIVVVCLVFCGCGKAETVPEENLIEGSDFGELEEETVETKVGEKEVQQESTVVDVESEADETEAEETRNGELVREIYTNNYNISMSNPSASTELNGITDERILINIPAFAYNEGVQYNESNQTFINKEIQLTSVGEHLELLTSDDLSDLYEYKVDYAIKKADDDIISIQYLGQLYTIAQGMSFSHGITIDMITGEKIPVGQYLKIDDNLLEDMKNGKIGYEPLSGYEMEDMLYFFETFIYDYTNGYVDEYTCYFLNDSAINLIVPIQGGNSSYFVLEICL